MGRVPNPLKVSYAPLGLDGGLGCVPNPLKVSYATLGLDGGLGRVPNPQKVSYATLGEMACPQDKISQGSLVTWLAHIP